MLVGDVQFVAGVFFQLVERLPVSRIVEIVDQAQDPVKRVARDAVELGRGVEEVLLYEIVVSEGHHGGCLRRVGVARP